MLRLKRIRPGGVMCFLLFEGVIALALLLSLAELVNWWSVLVLPATVAGLVKINDIVADAFARSDATMRFTTRRGPGSVRGTAPVPRARPRRDADVDVETEVLNPPVNRRRATNQRPFAPATGGRRRRTQS
ncbi:MAG TPA: hypothetical protein VGJ28_23730 [Micromonosporaceae bacterium]